MDIGKHILSDVVAKLRAIGEIEAANQIDLLPSQCAELKSQVQAKQQRNTELENQCIFLNNKNAELFGENDQLRQRIEDSQKQEPLRLLVTDSRYGSEDLYDVGPLELTETQRAMPLYAVPIVPPVAEITINERLKCLALDYVRCGIGANYSRESFEKRMDEIYTPFKKIIELIPISPTETDNQ